MWSCKIRRCIWFSKKKKKKISYMNSFYSKKKKNLGTIKREIIEILVPIRDHFSKQ